jgi:hypothetical protein
LASDRIFKKGPLHIAVGFFWFIADGGLPEMALH